MHKDEKRKHKASIVDGFYSLWRFAKTLVDFAVKILRSYSSKTFKSALQIENILMRLPWNKSFRLRAPGGKK